MKAAIVIEKWKLPIFSRHLHEAGFSYEDRGPLTVGAAEITLMVETPSREALQPVVIAAQWEARGRGKRAL